MKFPIATHELAYLQNRQRERDQAIAEIRASAAQRAAQQAETALAEFLSMLAQNNGAEAGTRIVRFDISLEDGKHMMNLTQEDDRTARQIAFDAGTHLQPQGLQAKPNGHAPNTPEV